MAAFGDEIKSVSSFDRKPCESIYWVFNVFFDLYGICGANVDLICDFCFTLASDICRGRVGRRAGREAAGVQVLPESQRETPEADFTLLAL